MGVSKFFRWMSERYPFVLQLVEENRIPQFDNLYLDMNGIIHHCSHPNEGDAHFRITEEQIFLGIFSYLEHLFALVKPQKLFFLAVDGVAPRAKMNQQRSRRFKAARERQELNEKAIRKGQKLPSTEAFDSNCITPGTPFMARLSEQLKYFINKKVSEDSAWKEVQVVFSGHDVPGEGEHKIMEFIRLSKAQADYNANVRHCLYGLDADLIMLALLSHDPHFCLLREEVKFGHDKKSQGKGLESQRFYLLHISLVREYLDWEFASLRRIQGFHYDLERVIDDFILLCIFVGNDFLPHLPGLHINEGALGMLFNIYKKIIPKAGGYLNEFGTLSTSRLQLVLDELVNYERENFQHEVADSSWLQGKLNKPRKPTNGKDDSRLILSAQQSALLAQVEQFVRSNAESPQKYDATLALPASYPAKDRKFLKKLAAELNLSISYDEFDENDEPLITLAFGPDSSDFDGLGLDSAQDMLQSLQINEENGNITSLSLGPKIEEALQKYKSAPIEGEWNEDDFDRAQAQKFEDAFRQWKAQYYAEKMQLDYNNPDHIHKLAYAYVEGLQWVLHYYYDGVASWSWFYPYHYSPKISDLCQVGSYEFSFDLGHPFKPFEQLMGVLPELSSAHVPPAYRELMSNSESPIIDLYPQEFDTDLNGKKHDWEAIVKIPFIDQERLLKAMKAHEHKLLDEERRRNEFGPSWSFQHDPQESITYPSSLAGFFPDLYDCHSRMTKYDLPTLGGLRLIKGLCEGVLLGKDTIAGFPSLHNLPHAAELSFHGVKIHQSESRSETIVIQVENMYEGTKVEDLANTLIGTQVYVGYPFLKEAKVVALSDSLFRYDMDATGFRSSPHNNLALHSWQRTADRLEYDYSKKSGLVIGHIDVIVHVKMIKGLKRMDDGALVKQFEERETEEALQTVVLNVSSDDPRFLEQDARPITEDFPQESKVFFLGAQQYGAPGQVVGHTHDKLTLRIMFFMSDKQENFAFRSALKNQSSQPYLPSHVVSKRLGMGALTLSKVTSSLMVQEQADSDNKVNIGLNVKFEAKSQKVLGYTKKGENGWEYSAKAIELIAEYQRLFPQIFRVLDSHAGRDITSAEDFFPQSTSTKLSEVKAWIKEKGVRDFERVPLHADMLDSASIDRLESTSARFLAGRIPENMKQAIVRNVPRKAVLKPAHADERLRGQTFELGDRVAMVSDRGTVPISAKGTCVGVTEKLVDVVFDGPFIGGTNLSNRCVMYRGISIPPSTVLNLTSPQYIQSITGEQPRPTPPVKAQDHMGLRFSRGRAVQPALQPRQPPPQVRPPPSQYRQSQSQYRAPPPPQHRPDHSQLSHVAARGRPYPTQILQPPNRSINHANAMSYNTANSYTPDNFNHLKTILQPDQTMAPKTLRGRGQHGWGAVRGNGFHHEPSVVSPTLNNASFPPRGRGGFRGTTVPKSSPSQGFKPNGQVAIAKPVTRAQATPPIALQHSQSDIAPITMQAGTTHRPRGRGRGRGRRGYMNHQASQ